MAARLKVFVTSDGLTDYVVAATSRPKALAAWGVRQDLFKEGVARQTDDPDLIEAATARPGEVLRKSTGAKAPKLKPQPKMAGPSRAQLRKVADLELKLAELDAEHDRALSEIARQRADLDRRERALGARAAARRRKLAAALSAARG